MDFAGQLQMKKTPVQVRIRRNVLYFDDGALALYRSLGGEKTVEVVSESLPASPPLGNLINDEWREERP